MTLARFVRKNAFRNTRRSILTVLSIGFSLLLLTLMISVWKSFYIDKGSAQSSLRLITRHRVSLTFTMPEYYRQKIRAVPGVAAVVPQNWFGGVYKNDKSNNFFAQFGTDPDEFFTVYNDFKIPPDQVAAWQRDRAGCVVDSELAKKYGWKVGDHIVIIGQIFPVNLELTIRGIFTAPAPTQSLYFNQKYVEEAVPYMKGQQGFYTILADSPQDVSRIQKDVDAMFRDSPAPTKTETEKAFQLGFVAMLGNVKAFLLSISLAVVFAILLVSANTMAMSIRERTREVAVLKTLGFTRRTILGLFISEAVILALVGGILGSIGAFMLTTVPTALGGAILGLIVCALVGLVMGWISSPLKRFRARLDLGGTILGLFAGLLLGKGVDFSSAGFFGDAIKVHPPAMAFAWILAALVGFLSAAIPAYHASHIGIVDGLRHIG